MTRDLPPERPLPSPPHGHTIQSGPDVDVAEKIPRRCVVCGADLMTTTIPTRGERRRTRGTDGVIRIIFCEFYLRFTSDGAHAASCRGHQADTVAAAVTLGVGSGAIERVPAQEHA